VTLNLIAHPDFSLSPIETIEVSLSRLELGRIGFSYRVLGNVDAVVWPSPNPEGPSQAMGLWEHSCFEAFVRPVDHDRYVELNFAPSGKWMAVMFEQYRGAMRESGSELNNLTWHIDVVGGKAELNTDVSFRVLGEGALMLNLTAVIEAKDGSKSYWALAHAPGKPDFHNADCFTARLAAPERA
jgi:hypothetical protein